MDAEVPALSELARVARESGDASSLPDIVAALWPRRRILDKSTETLFWLTFSGRLDSQGKPLSAFDSGLTSPIGTALEKIDGAAESLVRQDGMLMAQSFFHALKNYGLPKNTIFTPDAVPLGRYVFFELIPGPGMTRKVDDNSVTFQVNARQSRPFNCRETNKIDGYDPFSGKVIYRQDCQVKQSTFKISFQAELRVSAPPWAKDQYSPVWVLGKLKRVPQVSGEDSVTDTWALSDAQVVDFRFLGPTSQINFGSGAGNMF